MRRSIIQRTLMLGLLLAAGACGDSTDTAAVLSEVGPEPGSLAVTVASPFADDGAYSLELRGAGITNIRPADDGAELFAREVGPVINVAVLGAALSGTVVKFDVPDVRDPGAYSVVLVEVADEANAVRRDLSGHRAEVTALR